MRLAIPLSSALTCLFLLAGSGWTEDPKNDEKKLRERIEKLNHITGEDPINGQVAELVADKAGTKKLLSVALALLKENENNFNVNSSLILARAAHRLKEVDAAEKFYRLNGKQALQLRSSQKLINSYTGLIDLYWQNGKLEASEKVCQEFLELPDTDDGIRRLKMLVLRRLVQTQARLGKTDTAIKTVDNLIKSQPDNWLMRELKAQVHRDAAQYKEAAEVYEDVLKRIEADKRLDKEQKEEFGADIRYALSGVYVDLKQIDKAAEQLKILLAKEPDNPTYNNDLGFIWADHDMNLEESEKLIRKAIAEDRKIRKKLNLKPEDDKDNPAYLDSLGWVLYKQKKYKEALEPMLEAIKHEDGQHVEIYDHLGDIYLALDQKGKAIDAFKKALQTKPLGKRDELRKKEIEKKLKKIQAGENKK